MEDAVEDIGRAGTPTHLWIVGILGTLWNAFGVFDYLMTETRNAAYLANYGPDAIAYFTSFPAWSVAFWALGVWGGLAGSLLLLARNRHAVTVYAVSLIGLLGTTVYQFGMSNPPESLMTPGMMAMTMVIWAVAIGLLVYARAMRKKGVLR